MLVFGNGSNALCRVMDLLAGVDDVPRMQVTCACAGGPAGSCTRGNTALPTGSTGEYSFELW